MRSPRTPIRFPRSCETRRFRRRESLVILLGIEEIESAGRVCLLGGDGGLFRQHDRNIVANGINAAASLAFQTGLVGRQLNRGLAYWADEDIEQVLRNGHLSSPSWIAF